MDRYSEVFVGLDVVKARHAVAVAEAGRDPAGVRRLVGRLAKRHCRLHFCYEAGPTGYGLYRQLTEMGHQCAVISFPSKGPASICVN